MRGLLNSRRELGIIGRRNQTLRDVLAGHLIEDQELFYFAYSQIRASCKVERWQGSQPRERCGRR